MLEHKLYAYDGWLSEHDFGLPFEARGWLWFWILT